MPTTDDITDAAKKLGEQLKDHNAIKSYKDATKALKDDVSTQRAIADFNRALQEIALKEQQGKPIEVADKHRLRDLQDAVVMNPALGRMQQAQMDYYDLLRKIDDTIQEQLGLEDALPGGAGGSGAGAAPPPGGGGIHLG